MKRKEFAAAAVFTKFTGLGAYVLTVAACTHPKIKEPRDVEIVNRSHFVDQKLLESSDAAEEYKLGANQRFRMPLLLQGLTPQLPSDSTRTTLQPTTVCVSVVLTDRGVVDRIDALDDRDNCHASSVPENADLIEAVRESLAKWTFSPAAMCNWKPGTNAPFFGGCAGAETILPVPVTLSYSFTFEILEGKTFVRQVP